MDADAQRVLRLLHSVKALYEGGSRDDALALYTYLSDAWPQIERRNLWDGDDEACAQAVDLLLWLSQHDEVAPFPHGWPDWLAQWLVTTHRPVRALRPLKFKQS